MLESPSMQNFSSPQTRTPTISTTGGEPPHSPSQASQTQTETAAFTPLMSKTSVAVLDGMELDDLPPPMRTLPQFYYECHMKDLVTLVSRFLLEIVALNDKIPVSADNLTRFHSRTPPNISIRDYLLRIIRFCSIDRAMLMVVIYFIDVLSRSYQQFQVNTLTVHRFIVTSVTVACKGLCDSFCTNAHYAKVGGLSTVELNMLEVEFLSKVQYKIVPPPSRLDKYFTLMLERHSENIDFVAKGPLLTGPWAGLVPPGLSLPADRSWTPDSVQSSDAPSDVPDDDGEPASRERRRNGFRAAMRGMSKFLNNPKKRRDVSEDGRPVLDVTKRSKA